MKKIPLVNGRGFTLIDDADYDRVSQGRWYLKVDYAGRTDYVSGTPLGSSKLVYLHRFIMGASKGVQVDHVDGDGLNNQTDNLRLCSRSQNMANMPKQRGTRSSRFKGVSFYKRTRRWQAQIGMDGQLKPLGYFDSETEAARAYNTAALEQWGEFAQINNL